MGARLLSRWLLLAAIAVAVVAWAGTARVAGGSGEPTVEIERVSGTLEVTNSRSGQAIFQATGLAPGRSVTGTVQLSNAGSLAGELGLAQLDLQDAPGANGGRLSDGVHLDVQDITGGSSIPVFSGQLGGLGTTPLGSIAAGESRTYRFTAALPDTGAPLTATTGDNAYAGSGLTVRYQWTATAPDEGAGGTGGETGGTGGTGETGGSGITPTPTSAPTAKVKVVSKKLLTRGLLDVMASCDIACRVTTYAVLPKAKRARRASKTRAVTGFVNVPNKAARFRLKVSKKGRKALLATLRTKRRVVLSVRLSATPAQGGPARAYSRNVSVRRPKRRG